MTLPEDIALPAVAKELIRLVGLDDAYALMRRFGGGYLDVPINPNRATQLQGTISPEAVGKLCAYYAGGRISYIPKLDFVVRAIRNGQIREDCKTMGRRAVALKYGISVSAVHNIAGEIQRDAGHQISLF